jgi:class 3 adenylate cyclase
MGEQLESQTRGFLFADLRDYTRFVEVHGDQAAAELLARYRVLVREVIARFNGAEIRTEGDSFYVVFSSASAAVQGGLAILAAAAAAGGEPGADALHVGVGVHAGETAETPEGFVGSAVNLAARICALAGPGELLVSDTVRGLTRTFLAVQFVPRGRRRLKGIAEPVLVYEVMPSSATAGARAPGAGTRWRLSRSLVLAATAIGLPLVLLAAAAPQQLPARSQRSGLDDGDPGEREARR